jgi:hypothetical protein
MAIKKEFEQSQPNVNVDKGLAIAKGFVHRFSHVNKFGYNAATSSAFETVTDAGGTYSYPATAGTIQLIADDSQDNNSTVEVQGLDENYNAQTISLTVGGARSTQQFIRVFRMTVTTANTGTTNVDVINCVHTQSDSTDTTVAKILAGNGQTLMAVYTVPAGKKAYLMKFQGSQQKDQDTTFRLMTRPSGGAFNIKGQWAGRGGQINYDYPVPIVFGEKTDIEVQIKTGSASEGGALFDVVLEDLV